MTEAAPCPWYAVSIENWAPRSHQEPLQFSLKLAVTGLCILPGSHCALYLELAPLGCRMQTCPLKWPAQSWALSLIRSSALQPWTTSTWMETVESRTVINLSDLKSFLLCILMAERLTLLLTVAGGCWTWYFQDRSLLIGANYFILPVLFVASWHFLIHLDYLIVNYHLLLPMETEFLKRKACACLQLFSPKVNLKQVSNIFRRTTDFKSFIEL